MSSMRMINVIVEGNRHFARCQLETSRCSKSKLETGRVEQIQKLSCFKTIHSAVRLWLSVENKEMWCAQNHWWPCVVTM